MTDALSKRSVHLYHLAVCGLRQCDKSALGGEDHLVALRFPTNGKERGLWRRQRRQGKSPRKQGCRRLTGRGSEGATEPSQTEPALVVYAAGNGTNQPIETPPA
jgi:hypothetical protein